jgi:hypothetical protein
MWLLSVHFINGTVGGTNTMNAYYITVLLTVNALNSAFFNVVVNALMVAQSRKDLKNGSSDL